jgi:hypothetical protein
MSAKPAFKMPDRRVDEWVGRGEGGASVTQPTTPSPPAPEPAQAAIVAPPTAPEPEKPKVKQARLTIDLDAPLHARFKATCALRGTNMVDEVRGFIEQWIEES